MFLLPKSQGSDTPHAAEPSEKAMLVQVRQGIYKLIEDGRRDLLLQGLLVEVITDQGRKMTVDPARLILYETDLLIMD